jgi:hypothetical protein
MPDFSLIKFEGKPLEKLVDVISKGVGKLYEPRAIRKEAEAKAYELEIIEKAKSKALQNHKDIEQDIIDRIEERILHRELKKQKNLDQINFIAADQLKNEKEVSEESVNEDWANRFFEYAEDISNEEMQNLWGKILAGEVKRPNSYSLRTLELLKNITKIEAEVFLKFARISITSQNTAFVVNDGSEYLKNEHGISYGDRLLMEEVGLMTANDLTFKLRQAASNSRTVFVMGDTVVVVDREANVPLQSIPILAFTKSGMELLGLTQHSPKQEYLDKLASLLKNEKVKVSCAKIIEIKNNGTINHTLPMVNLTKK